jgi:hypothetical protein
MRAMRRHRILPAALATLALTAGAALLHAAGSAAKPSAPQALFEKTLLEDARTTPAIKDLFQARGGFVAPEIVFADLTGDGRSDAVVLVETGGLAGAVAAYVFSTDGQAEDSPLRAVYSSQRLYRASVEVADGTLIVRTPRYAEGDDVCCPVKIVERVYAWSAKAKTMRQRSSREVPGPT